MQNKASTLSILGIVFGGLGLLVSFIPCLGTLAIFPAILGLILSIPGFRQDRRNGASKTAGIVGIVCSSIGILVSGGQMLFFKKVGSEAAKEINIEYDSCDKILAAFETTIKELNEIKKDENPEFSDMSKLIKLTTKVAKLGKRSEELQCKEDEDFKTKMQELEKLIDE